MRMNDRNDTSRHRCCGYAAMAWHRHCARSIELLGAYGGLQPVKVFDEFDIGIIFKRGQPRLLKEIKNDSLNEFKLLDLKRVNKQFWLYTSTKLFGKHFKINSKRL